MRNIRTAVAAFAATGLAAFGAMAAMSGVANAATNQSITGCAINNAVIGVQLLPSCEADPGTIYNATEVTAFVDQTFLQAFLGHLGLGVRVNYDLACSVDGSTRHAHEGFTTNDPHHNWQTVNLQQAVGSPEPNQCTVENLTARSLLSVTVVRPIIGFGVHVVGDNGVPGAIWAQYPASTSGAGSTVCADDTSNGNDGTQIQAFQCEQDLADQWMQVSKQLIHNGDCMTNVAGDVKLQRCMPGQHWAAPNQSWDVHGTPFSSGQITQGNGWCLSAPASGMVDGAHLTVQHCGASGYVQQWKAPANTPV